MAQIKEGDIEKLQSTVQDINNLLQFLESGKRFFLIAEEQQEIALMEISKRVELATSIMTEMDVTLSKD